MNRLTPSSAECFARVIQAVESLDQVSAKSIQDELRVSLQSNKVASEKDLDHWFFTGNLPSADGSIDQFPGYLLYKLIAWSAGMAEEELAHGDIPDALEGVRRAVVQTSSGSAIQHSLAMRLDFDVSHQRHILECLEAYKDFWLSPEANEEQLFAATESLKTAWRRLDPQTLAGLIIGQAVLQEGFQEPPLVFATQRVRLVSAVRFSRFARPLLDQGWICFTWVFSGGRFFFNLNDLPT